MPEEKSWNENKVSECSSINKDYGKMPLSLIPNKGQMNRQVYFYLQGKDKRVYFTSTGLTYSLAGPAESQPGPLDKAKTGFPTRSSSRWVVKLDFVGARKDARPECLEKSGTVISYFKDKAAEWQTGLEAASKIIYRDLWPGIDLVYYGTFPVNVGPDLTYNGGEYDMFVAKLKADGTSLDYCGYIGGSLWDYGKAIAVDGSGCAYVTGETNSDETTFPVNFGTDLTQNGVSWDVVWSWSHRMHSALT